MILPQLSPAFGTTMTWLIDGVRSASQTQDVLQQLCNQLATAGPAIDRSAVFVSTPHPDVTARRFS